MSDTLTPAQIRKMSAEEIADRIEEVDRVLSGRPRRPLQTPADLEGLTPDEIADRIEEVDELMAAHELERDEHDAAVRASIPEPGASTPAPYHDPTTGR